MANLHPDAGRGLGVDPLGDKYPLIDPSADVRGLLADFYLVHEADLAAPLALTWLHGFDAPFGYEASESASDPVDPGSSSSLASAHPADLLVLDALGRPAFDSRSADSYAGRPWGPRLYLHEWRAEHALCRAVQHAAFPAEGSVIVHPSDLYPADGRLDGRCHERMQARVLSLRSGPGDPEVGSFALAAGHNIRFEVATGVRGIRPVTELVIHAEPGAGTGRAPGCEDPEKLIRRIAGSGVEVDGAFALVAAGCYYARQPVAGPTSVPEAATLKLGNDCVPCCSCDDYVAVQEGVLAVWDSLEATAARRDLVQAAHAANLARWLESKSCRESRPVAVNAMAHHGAKVEVAAAVCNHSRDCLADVVLTVELRIDPDGTPFGVDPASVYVTDLAAGSRVEALVPVTPTHGGQLAYEFVFDTLPGLATGSVRFTVDVIVGADPIQFTIIGTSSLTYLGSPVDPATRAVTL